MIDCIIIISKGPGALPMTLANGSFNMIKKFISIKQIWVKVVQYL